MDKEVDNAVSERLDRFLISEKRGYKLPEHKAHNNVTYSGMSIYLPSSILKAPAPHGSFVPIFKSIMPSCTVRLPITHH